MRTQVGIVGASPAGLVLARLLEREGIDSVVLERRSRSYVEGRVRAGVLEHGTADLLDELGVGARMRREGMVHRGIELRFDGVGHRIDLEGLTGRTITVYGQQEVVKDLIAARIPTGPLHFEAEVTGVDGTVVAYKHDGVERRLECDFVAELRRLARRRPGRRAARCADRRRARAPVRVAGHPGPRARRRAGAGLRVPRTGFRPAQHADPPA
nr:hypothetical protein GCM10020092_049910 [Actinoplanes digitatis]